ncbi:hypothetical protein [Psychromonas sp. MME2]|uniref:hypothetical protein n=1 Tax=Psychromonas sp. MME2 TaxID=3231033 RepID=UPI00339BB729
MSLLSYLYHSCRVLLRLVVAFIMVLFVTVMLLLLTHRGNVLLLNGVERFEPRLSLQLLEGSILNAPKFADIRWEDPLNQIQIDNLSYRLGWPCLIKKLCIEALTVSDAKIIIQQSPPSELDAKEVPEPDSPFQFPLDIIVDAVNLKNINLLIDDQSIQLNSLSLQAAAQKNVLTLSAVLDGITVTLPMSTTEPGANEPVAQAATLPALLAESDLIQINMPIALNVTSLQVDDFALRQNNETLFKVNSLKTNLSFIDTKLSITTLQLDIPESDLMLNGEIDFNDHYPLTIHTTGSIKNITSLQPTQLLAGQKFTLALDGDLADLSAKLTLRDKMWANINAQTSLLAENLPYTLAMDWHNLQWPLTGKADYLSTQGTLKSSGDVSHYQLDITGDYEINSVPKGVLNLSSSGNLTELQISRLLVKTLNGELDLNGHINWQKELQWAADLSVDKLDLSLLDSQYKGVVSGN